MSDFNALADNSRVWIYQAKEEISKDIIDQIQTDLDQFTRQWTAHSRALKAAAELRHNRFIILSADESQAGASGCSIDSSVRFIKGLEEKYNLELFDRMTFTFIKQGKIHAAGRDQFAELYNTGILNDETIVFDNLIKTKGQLKTDWEKKLGDSWHVRMV